MNPSNIEELVLERRFDTSAMRRYYALYRKAADAGKKLRVFATAEARARFKTMYPPVFADFEFAELEFYGYPNSETAAQNVARGLPCAFVLFIDERGRYTDIIKSTLTACGDCTGLIVSLTVDEQR